MNTNELINQYHQVSIQIADLERTKRELKEQIIALGNIETDKWQVIIKTIERESMRGVKEVTKFYSKQELLDKGLINVSKYNTLTVKYIGV